jgi:hypothetical protein
MKQDFIERARKVHDGKYVYDLVEYKGALLKIKIICPAHGLFEQAAHHHLEGQGCPRCSKIKNKPPVKRSNPIRNKNKAVSIHNDLYDYTKTDFSSVKTKVIIICKIHGEFYQTLGKHLCGRGCPDCGGSRKKTQEEFLVEAKNTHGDLYDYSLSKYDNFEKKIIIICRRHGEFYQTPHNHIIGKQGCPVCVHRISKPEIEWLNSLGLPNDNEHRNVLLKLPDRKIKADGYEPSTGTVYEFYGDYYHGNPLFFDSNVMNPHTKCTFGELYKKTLDKENSILKNGLKLVCIWEHEWKS